MTIKTKLELFMKEFKLNQVGAAEIIGVSPSTISKALRGVHDPSKSTKKLINEGIASYEDKHKKQKQNFVMNQRFIKVDRTSDATILTFEGEYRKFIETLLYKIQGVNMGIVPREELTEWLRKKID